jgi:hypothetical protein
MDLLTTLIAIAVFLGLAVFCGWRGARPPNLLKGPRMAPWRPMMMACAVITLLLAAHLLNLLGFQTGDPRY